MNVARGVEVRMHPAKNAKFLISKKVHVFLASDDNRFGHVDVGIV